MKIFNEEKEKELFQHICDTIIENFPENTHITDYYQKLKKLQHGKFIPLWEPKRKKELDYITSYHKDIVNKFTNDICTTKNQKSLFNKLVKGEFEKIKRIVRTAAMIKIIALFASKDFIKKENIEKIKSERA